MVDAGKVKAIGVSECSVEDIKTIHSIVPVTLAELEWSLFSREQEVSIGTSLQASHSHEQAQRVTNRNVAKHNSLKICASLVKLSSALGADHVSMP